MPTRFAERVYSILVKFAEAKPDYYSSEEFIFHFGVVDNTDDYFKLTCTDSAQRTFVCRENGEMFLIGKGRDRVNPILHKISQEMRGESEYREFIIRKHEI